MLNDLFMTDALMEVVSDAREKANRHGERFNIFSILRVHRNEAETHSRFLHELLNPQGRHGEGCTFLNLFLESVLGLQTSGEGRYRVRRELATEEKRRVDIVIESPDTIAGIELKIDAADQKAQLHDYYQELQRRAGGEKQVVLAYLTLDGKSPSAMSLNGLSKGQVACLSFSDEVSRWLQGCIEKSPHKPALANAIRQYQQLIHNLTGKGGTMSDLVAGELNSDVERFKEALEVEKSLPRAKASVQEVFWQELRAALEAQFGVTPSVYGGNSIAAISHDYYSKNRNNKHIGIKMPIYRLGDRNICLYVNLYHAVHYGLRMEDETGTVASSPDLKEVAQEKIGKGNAQADREADWLVCFYYNPGAGDEEKIIRFDTFNNAAIGLLDREVRRTLIADMVAHQSELAEKAKALCSR
ncbi:PDDEXK-like family protein [Halomonas ventosae]|uniref:PD-(D/E)XK nuclease superfamily protein n=1 Tax=Halomonas ventosae TaxID=229007 RepID=A0A2T0VIH8_9GAMM|nr:PD-(D/E)XK nuclease family protein [Halomonas ventosae]PRY69867.1 PD-(D/E)XK nuclease superfamily protein [Halomonas ventosae]